MKQSFKNLLPGTDEEFVGRTQSEEGLLQISLHLLPDALLHVVGTVALIPLKHWQHKTHIRR